VSMRGSTSRPSPPPAALSARPREPSRNSRQFKQLPTLSWVSHCCIAIEPGSV
jgi:hypothetical protein